MRCRWRREWAEQLVARARAEGVELTGDTGLLTAMIRQVLQTGFEVELSEHLGYETHDPAAAVRGTPATGRRASESPPMSVMWSWRYRGTVTAPLIRGPSRNINDAWMACRGV